MPRWSNVTRTGALSMPTTTIGPTGPWAPPKNAKLQTKTVRSTTMPHLMNLARPPPDIIVGRNLETPRETQTVRVAWRTPSDSRARVDFEGSPGFSICRSGPKRARTGLRYDLSWHSDARKNLVRRED